MDAPLRVAAGGWRVHPIDQHWTGEAPRPFSRSSQGAL
jgi:hypothetical protein